MQKVKGIFHRTLKSCATLITCLHMNMLDFSSNSTKLTKGSSRKVHIVSPLVSCYNNNLSLLPYFAVRIGPKDSRCVSACTDPWGYDFHFHFQVLPCLLIIIISTHKAREDRHRWQITYILLHKWEGSTGEYSVRGWQYWPDRREGQYTSREPNILLYCPT